MSAKKQKISSNNSEKVGRFYNETTHKFLAVYGEIIQAFRTQNVEDYLNYTLRSMNAKEGEQLLDAGCGVCGPATFFADKFDKIHIEALTISDVQVEEAQKRIEKKGLSTKVNVQIGDYHFLSEKYGKEKFDLIYFLESFGHSSNKSQVIDTCWEALKPGGRVYIKDLFRRESDDEWEQLRINQICKQIDDAYEYHIADLNSVLSKIRSKGFILKFVKVPEVEVSQFEHLTISNDFQNLFNIGKIDSWEDYIFPIDFYEILAEKPQKLSAEDLHLYFMNKQ